MLFLKQPGLKNLTIILFSFLCIFSSCDKIDVFEKNVSLPKQSWPSDERPVISFNITDTSSLYNMFIVLRHSDAYGYNNIWLNVYAKGPSDSTEKKQQVNLQLANNEKGWLASGMDDIFEHRIRITQVPFRFQKAGEYQFRLQQIMREDPLQHVLNVGLRIEKVK